MSFNPNIKLTDKGLVMHYAFPGGYPIFYLTKENETLCPQCVQTNISDCCNVDDVSWYVESTGINYEDDNMMCCECNATIDCAYDSE